MGYIIVLAKKLWQDNKGRRLILDQMSRSNSDNTVSDFSLLFRDTQNKQTEYRHELLNADYDQSKTNDFTMKQCMLYSRSQVKLPQD